MYQDFAEDTWTVLFTFNNHQIEDKYNPVIPLSVVRPNQNNELPIQCFVNLKSGSISCITNSTHCFKNEENVWISGIVIS